MGALVQYITQTPTAPFQPMNINFGILPQLPGKGREKRRLLAIHALKEMEKWKEEVRM
jgi:methylenetetrahydrofolate--tRNA-(uracil-5-)-methyltransferase